MRPIVLAAACSLLALGLVPAATAAPAAASAVLTDPSRPAADRARDAARKPAEMVDFAGIHAGSKVADMIPGGGYFTRVFSLVVGAGGHVYAFVPASAADMHNAGADARGLAAAYPNVTATIVPLQTASFPEPLDVVWTAQNYHDFHNFGPGVVDLFNKAAFNALKPGGVYVIVDHADKPGSGASDTNTLHRIEQSTVRAEVEAAGFKFDSQTTVLANPADPHTAAVFDPSIRGHTDQFAMKFKKPG